MAYSGALHEVSNRASWNDVVELRDTETGELFDFSDAQEIVVQVVNLTYDNFFRFGYGYGFGGYIGAPIITASLSAGTVQIIAQGQFQFAFTRATMNTLPPGDYNAGMTMVKDEETTQLFIGQVRVREGVVTIQAGTG
jgi:hypothetical protein